MASVIDRIQAGLMLLSDAMGSMKVPSIILNPLIRTLVASLTVCHLAHVQSQAVAVLGSMCKSYSDLRRTIIDEVFLQAMPYFGSTKNPQREYIIGDETDDTPLRIHVISAALIHIVQSSVEWPSVDDDNSPRNLVLKAYAAPVKVADYFWSLCLDRLPATKAIKADTDHDFAAVLAVVVQDMLSGMALPQWPAASTLILRLASSLNAARGLHHPDAVVRQACVDILGRVLCCVHLNDVRMHEDLEWLSGIAEDNEFDDIAVAAPELLLKFLSDATQTQRTVARSARVFWLTKNLSEDAAMQEGQFRSEHMGMDELDDLEPPSNRIGATSRTNDASIERDRFLDLLIQYRNKSEELETLTFETGLTAEDARKLMRPVLHSVFLRASPAMLSWLVDVLNSKNQAPNTRSKTVKVLSDLAAVDPSIMQLAPVHAAVERALQDESISVREASITLLGKHMAGDVDLTSRLLDTIIQATDDAGASVRRSAIKILRDCAIVPPNFPRAADAACAVLARIGDPEESVQTLVARLFHGIWFSSTSSSDQKESTRKRSGGQRGSNHLQHGSARGSMADSGAALRQQASVLVEVAKTIYESGGSSIRLPFDIHHPLVATLRQALAQSTENPRGTGATKNAHGVSNRMLPDSKTSEQAIAESLLDFLFSLQTGVANGDGDAAYERFAGSPQKTVREAQGCGEEDSEQAAFPILLALHALSVADPALMTPSQEPGRFIRALAPLLKSAPDTKYPAEVERRRAAERLLCVLSIMEAVLKQEVYLDDSLGLFSDMPSDLLGLINQHRYTQVVAAAIKCLAALSSRSTAAAKKLYQTATVYFSWLQAPENHSSSNIPRFLFILGHLARYGADVIDQYAERSFENDTALPGKTVSLSGCLMLFIGYWHASYSSNTNKPSEKVRLRALEGQIRRYALEAVGQLAIARPLVLVEASSEAKAMLDEALSPESLPQLQLSALAMLTELLQADAESLVQRQKAEVSERKAIAGKRTLSARTKKKSRSKKSRKKIDVDTDESNSDYSNDDEDHAEEEDGPRDKDNAAFNAVAIENGEGDALSQSSAILQQHWDAVLKLATIRRLKESGKSQTDIRSQGHAHAGAMPEAEMSIGVRRRVLGLTEIVLRDGLVGPWTAVPILVALSTDTIVDIRARALRLLCQLSEKHPQYADADKLCTGLRSVFMLHTSSTDFESEFGDLRKEETQIKESMRAFLCSQLLSSSVLSGTGMIYTKLIQPSRPRRISFLRSLLQPFRTFLSGSKSGVSSWMGIQSVRSQGSMKGVEDTSSLMQLLFLGGVIAGLPFRKGEEPCLMIKEISGILTSHLDRIVLEISGHLDSYRSDDEEEDVYGRFGSSRSPQEFVRTCLAGTILCILEDLRNYIMQGYGITHERIAAFAAAGNRKTVEESVTVSCSLNPLKDLHIESYFVSESVFAWNGKRTLKRAQNLLEALERMQQDAEYDR